MHEKQLRLLLISHINGHITVTEKIISSLQPENNISDWQPKHTRCVTTHEVRNLVFLAAVLGLRPVSRKSRKRFGPEKPFLKQSPAYSVKLVFWYVVKGTKIKITALFRVSERLHFELIKRLLSPEKFRGFRESGPWAHLFKAWSY